jgi:hypothetical protein
MREAKRTGCGNRLIRSERASGGGGVTGATEVAGTAGSGCAASARCTTGARTSAGAAYACPATNEARVYSATGAVGANSTAAPCTVCCASGCPREGRTKRDAYWRWCRPRWFSSRSRPISRQLRAAIHLRPTSAMRSAGWTWAPVAKRWSRSRARLTTWMPAVGLSAPGLGIRRARHD